MVAWAVQVMQVVQVVQVAWAGVASL